MSEVNLTNSNRRPTTPLKVLWFEFLLNPYHLEAHLKQDNPDPTAAELIIQFLANASIFSSNVLLNSNAQPFGGHLGNTPVQNNGITGDVSEIESAPVKEKEVETKKDKALKLLALQVAAFLKWDLGYIEKNIPLPMQYALLEELKKTLQSSAERDQVNLTDQHFGEMDPYSRFANMLHYCWNIRAVQLASYPLRGQKGLNVQIPGQADPTSFPPDVMDNLMQQIQEEAESSSYHLEELVQGAYPVQMPLMECIATITEESSSPDHHWEKGYVLSIEEVLCQVAYDLGCFYFFQQKYDKANKMFLMVADASNKLRNDNFGKLNLSKLEGYVNACSHILGKQFNSGSVSLRERLQISSRTGHKQTVDILSSDNLRREISLPLRNALEIDILKGQRSHCDIYLHVALLNSIRSVMDGNVTYIDISSVVKGKESKAVVILCEELKKIIPSASSLQLVHLKHFVRMLCHISNVFVTDLKTSGILNKLFTPQEINNLLSCLPAEVNELSSVVLDQNFTDDTAIKVGHLERELISSYDPIQIRSLIAQIRMVGCPKPLWPIYQKWELPRHVQLMLKSIAPHVDEDLIYITLAKALRLQALKHYEESRQLLAMVKEEIKCFPQLLDFVNWVMLQLDLLEMMLPNQHPSQKQKIIQQASSCISAFQHERESSPDIQLLELCIAVLFNFQEWDILSEVEAKHEGRLEIASVLAAVCRDVYLNKGSRAASRDLWDYVIPIFGNASVYHKRSSSGIIKEVPRDIPHAVIGRIPFVQFIKKINDTLALTIIISCLAKFYNILKDDSTGEIYLEYQLLWPLAVTNSGNYSLQLVGEVFQETLHHALSEHPTHSSWLRTCGDLYYIQGNYASALKQYLSAAMVSSDYFSQPLPRSLFDTLQFRHMINCCTKLQCHTQTAVLIQLLEESNYVSAFKCLSEKVCNDSCDVYYPCIWDITLLEFLVNLHARRGEVERRQIVLSLIGQLELNSNNNEEIQREAANIRKGKFLRAMTKQYLQ